jgi:hypothetical protein
MANAAPKSSRWEETCSRLGVKPKQFTMLLTVCAVAIVALSAKTLLKPRGAAASVVAPAASQAPAPDAPDAGPAPMAAIDAPAAAGRTVRLTLETHPARDPFRPFFQSVAAAPAGATAPAGGALAAPAPKDLVLKAILSGELAVINDETLAVGDSVEAADGTTYVLEEIQERRVVLREGGRRAELGYATSSKKRPQSGAGALSPAHK